LTIDVISESKIDFRKALRDRYLSYAISTITDRALPDVRDGLKPVHRRLLYAMLQLKLNPQNGFKKCARIVGDVIGKYHPHGEQAVYEALVKLAQDFSHRYPLIEGQGNFGNIDGDNAAAMRYTESRITITAELLMEFIHEDTVEFTENYDGEEKEPSVMPSNFPNLLANGSSGIAVGMATNIPSHNIIELCDAALGILEKPDISIDEIMKVFKGPDFATGGIIINSFDEIIEFYKRGKGAFCLRSRWRKIEDKNKFLIEIIEIPYGIQKSKLIERIAELIQTKKVSTITDIRDNSAEDLSIIIEPRSNNIEVDIIMEELFSLTDLQINFSLNMNVLQGENGNIPKVLDLKSVISQWLDHRLLVLNRHNNYRLNKINLRMELLEGYIVAYLNLDEIIRIVREEDSPKKKLIDTFSLNSNQADAILDMKLRSLRKLEEDQIQSEYKSLLEKKTSLVNLLKSKNLQLVVLQKQVSEIKRIFSTKDSLISLSKRRTTFGSAVEVEYFLNETDNEQLTIVLSNRGWIKSYKGHGIDKDNFILKNDDHIESILEVISSDKVIICSNSGRFYSVAVNKINNEKGSGEPIRLLFDIGQKETIVNTFVLKNDLNIFLVTYLGKGMIVKQKSLVSFTRKGKQVFDLLAHDHLISAKEVKGNCFALLNNDNKLIVFPVDGVKISTKGAGITFQKLKDGFILDCISFYDENGLQMYNEKNKKFVIKDVTNWKSTRARTGKVLPKDFKGQMSFSTKRNAK
jgi:topoisomerase IV subunit A